jgi:hypothetical protein
MGPKTMRRIAIFFLGLAAGCTPMLWQKPDVSAEQLRADEADCRQRAAREASFSAWHYHAMFEPHFSRGGVVWPSGAMVDPYGGQLMEENRLSQFCMESKGYALVPVPKP